MSTDDSMDGYGWYYHFIPHHQLPNTQLFLEKLTIGNYSIFHWILWHKVAKTTTEFGHIYEIDTRTWHWWEHIVFVLNGQNINIVHRKRFQCAVVLLVIEIFGDVFGPPLLAQYPIFCRLLLKLRFCPCFS